MSHIYISIHCSRDTTNLEELITEDVLSILLENAGLTEICKEEQISHVYTTGKTAKIIGRYMYRYKVNFLIQRKKKKNEKK